jgi:hypothetical protein
VKPVEIIVRTTEQSLVDKLLATMGSLLLEDNTWHDQPGGRAAAGNTETTPAPTPWACV